MPVGLSLALAVLLVLLNGFFVAAEFALVKVRATQIRERAKGGSGAAKLAEVAIEHLDAYLSATQLGITLASIGLGWVGEPSVAALLDPLLKDLGTPTNVAHLISFAVAFTVISMFHIVLGELAPKSWAIQESERLTLWCIYPLHWFYVAFKWPIRALNSLANGLLRLFGRGHASEHDQAHSEEELRMILTQSGESGVLTVGEADLMKHVFRFGDKDASDIMTPRIDVVGLSEQTPVSNALKRALELPYSRYPVTGADIDDILGVIHLRDLLKLDRARVKTLDESVRRDVLRIPVTKGLEDLLHDFQKSRTHMAVVQDEYGGTAGIVTLEDVLEQLVGNIADESDIVSTAIEQQGEWWLLVAKLRLDEVNEAIGAEFESEDFDTIGGYVMGLIGRRPRPGMQITDGKWDFEILEAEASRILRLRVRKVEGVEEREVRGKE